MEKFMIQRAISRINNGINLANENVDKDRFDENSRHAIGELQICKKALEKQMPKKLNKIEFGNGHAYTCVCGRIYQSMYDTENNYCEDCGQRLDWEE